METLTAPPAPWEPIPTFAETDRSRLRHLRTLGLTLTHFFDVGAAHGYWSRRVSIDFPEARYDLFEPLVDHVSDYAFSMKKNLAEIQNADLHKIALGKESKQASMCLFPNPVGSTTLEYPPPVNGKVIDVPMSTIDAVVQKTGVPQVIKMDTQGSELQILEGARNTLPQVQVVLCECWLARGYGKSTPLLHEIMTWMAHFNFYLFDLGGVYRDKEGVLIAQDCFFLNASNPASKLGSEKAAKALSAMRSPA